METYLFKFSACLLVFWLVYVLFLERQTMHRFKRFYLLGAMASALIIPMLTIIHYIEPVVRDVDFAPQFIPVESNFSEMPLQEPPFWNLEYVLWLIYGLGAFVFTIRFAINLFKMYRRISENETVNKRSLIYVLLEECRIPHSFFKYIFLSRLKFETETIPKEVLLHEETHAKQLHSIDIIAIEILQIVFWFNPLIYILKYHIKLNHEFLADLAVLNQGSDAKTYQNILLQFSSPDSYRSTDAYQLSSAINYSSIKKRFTVMKTQTSKTRIWVSGLLLLPIIAILFYSFAEKEYVEKENTDIAKSIQDELAKSESLNMIYINESQDILGIWFNETEKKSFQIHLQNGGLILDLKEADKPYTRYYPKKSKSGWVFTYDNKKVEFELINGIINDSNGLTFEKISNKSTSQYLKIEIENTNQIKVNNKPETLESLLKHIKRIKQDLSPTEINKLIKVTVFDKTKDNKGLIEQITQSLESHGLDNILVHKFYTGLKEKDIPALHFYENDKPIMWILINRKDQLLVDDELGTLKSIENKLKKLAKQGESGRQVIIKYDKETSKGIISKVEDLIIANKFKVLSFDTSTPTPPPTKQEKATAKQVAAYNTWAKKINTAMAKAEDNNYVNAYPIVKVKEVNKYKAIYTIMSESQKRASESWPSFPPPPPPPPAPNKTKGGSNANEQNHDNVKTGFHKVNGQTLYYTATKGQTTYYNRSGQKVNRKGDVINSEQTHAEDVIEGQVISKVYKDDKVIAEFNTENMSIPPPTPPSPAPESTLDFVIRMAKANAKFFNEGKSISSDKAIELLKKNSKLNINAKNTDTRAPLVFITNKPIVVGVNGKVGESMSKKQQKILPIVNGKTITSEKLRMSLNEIKKLIITLPNSNITDFKFKIPGIKTEWIKGNSISKLAIENLKTAEIGDYITIFDIKDDKDSKLLPIVIEIIE